MRALRRDRILEDLCRTRPREKRPPRQFEICGNTGTDGSDPIVASHSGNLNCGITASVCIPMVCYFRPTARIAPCRCGQSAHDQNQVQLQRAGVPAPHLRIEKPPMWNLAVSLWDRMRGLTFEGLNGGC